MSPGVILSSIAMILLTLGASATGMVLGLFTVSIEYLWCP